jgi:hypothetical protein
VFGEQAVALDRPADGGEPAHGVVVTDGLAPVEFGEGVQEPEGVVGEVLMVGRPWDQPRRIHRQPLPDLRHMLMHGGRERGLIGELRETGRERAADPPQRGRRG